MWRQRSLRPQKNNLDAQIPHAPLSMILVAGSISGVQARALKHFAAMIAVAWSL